MLRNNYYIKQTTSTNELLWKMVRENALPEGYVVYTDFQTVGKGQIGNSWESEIGKNILFSMVLFPQKVPTDQLFLISQIISLAIKKVLDSYLEGVVVKWPNDIYWKNQKLGGILIENSFQANKVKTVVGIGINVNQKNFVSDAPNPVSLSQIIGKSVNRKKLLTLITEKIQEIYLELNVDKIRLEYAESLYRKDGFHSYCANEEAFQAKIVAVHPDGKLELETSTGEYRSYYFKEVQFQ